MANILIVEDEHIVAWDIKETLERLGHIVVDRVGSGIEAIESAESKAPDLVLMDIRLNGEMDGIVAGNQIYHRLDIPVVYLTAYADELTLKRATRTNPFGYIVKPFQQHSLQSTIQIALNRHELEESTKLAQAYLVNTLDSIGGGIIVTDRQGSITLMNPMAESLTGWQEHEALGIEIDRVFRLIWESDGMAIENPNLRAMRLNQTVKSPEKCWLVAKDNFEIPIQDTASPIVNRHGEIVGSIVIFQDNTDRVLRIVKLWEEHHQELEDFQLRFITHLQQETAQHQQAIACIDILGKVLAEVRTATSEYDILHQTLCALGTTLDIDYAWVSLHDSQTATARIICEYEIEGRKMIIGKVGRQLDLQLYPQFYQHLFQQESWIDPPSEILPSEYRNLLLTGAKLLILPIVIDSRIDDSLKPFHRKRKRNLTIGEVGIMTTGKPNFTTTHASLISQIFSYIVKLFSQTNLRISDREPIEASQWLNRVKDDFSDAIEQVERDLLQSAAMLKAQIFAVDPDESFKALELYQFLHRQLVKDLEITKVEWSQQLNLIDNLINFQAFTESPANLIIDDIEFNNWIDEIFPKFSLFTKQHQQQLKYKFTGNLPSIFICDLITLESILLKILTNVCQYTPADCSILFTVHTQANRLTFSFISSEVELSPTELNRISQSFPHIAPDRSPNWQLILVEKLVKYLEGEIQFITSNGATTASITISI